MILIDSYVKIYLELGFVRYFTKLPITVLLILYYLYNNSELLRLKRVFMLIALSLFLLGDFFFIKEEQVMFFSLAMACFILAKVFYILNFSNKRDFKLGKLLPLLSLSLVYGYLVMYFILPNLNTFYIPVLIYCFVELMVLIFAFLRQGNVDRKSFIFVFVGVIIAFFSDAITAIDTFNSPNFFYENSALMLLYGLSQYLIVIGVTEAVKLKNEDVIDARFL
ncbi:hypothetical protein GCM10022291_17800 [Postechiella marina]|uniref:YhhN-like protein n=2 Tax=Postechiella marina TaxID=943941 RepID=A0ABP8C8F0_9FLAO